MASIIIPGPASAYPDQMVKVPINGISYAIHWLWNTRGGAWFMSISDNDGPILSGVRVVLNVDLLNNTADPRKPMGVMIPTAPDGEAEYDPKQEPFDRVQIVFTDFADLELEEAV